MNPTLTRTWSAILFDLDGTITDSAPAITSSLARTFALLGRPVPSDHDLLEYVGPPLISAFQDYAGMSPEEAAAAVLVYRSEYHGAAALDTAVYPGIAGLLERISEAGIPLALATSKPEQQAIDILTHFDLNRFFTVTVGASTDGSRITKADIVAEALRRLGETGADVTTAVLVGDRSHDVVGAAANNVPAILVEWGYGSPAEAADAFAIVHSTDRLGKLLLG
ncbi:HAD hydrolase-like protein [Cryobacterium sp. CG_9.6]|uniref:HAD hydrolase-like protein n=1 Tax=Cryobacterium sp. CG_9.6 TaxID=2760710 RepID=UPI002472EA10|nr:HAD hydrolase-like protein [Cryobacterium sp. CG_9.6]MDH6235491.1 phosphoglycolate phosphatase [Cryobacterium sp. CG_9.6]